MTLPTALARMIEGVVGLVLGAAAMALLGLFVVFQLEKAMANVATAIQDAAEIGAQK